MKDRGADSITRRSLLASAAAIGATAMTTATPASAQSDNDFPYKPIRIIIPFPPGTVTDAVPRLFAEKLRVAWGQPVIIDNRAGANGMIATEAVVRAPPDGYTLGVALADTYSINPQLRPSLPYKPSDALVGVALYGMQPFVLVVHESVAARGLDEFIALARSKPGQIRFGSWGEGSTAHLTMLMLQRAAGFQAIHVAYRGAAAAITDLLGGHIDAMFVSVALVTQTSHPQLRNIAVTGTERDPLLPDLPALVERFPTVSLRSWFGIVAPAATPASIVEKLNAAINRALESPDLYAEVKDRYMASTKTLTVPQFADFLRKDAEHWSKIIATEGIRLD